MLTGLQLKGYLERNESKYKDHVVNTQMIIILDSCTPDFYFLDAYGYDVTFVNNDELITQELEENFEIWLPGN